MPPKDVSGAASIPSALAALHVLEAVLDSPDECRLSDLAEHLDMPKARIHRHLSQLRDAGFIAQNHRNRRYRAGWRLFVMGQRVVDNFDLPKRAAPIMERLRSEVGQTVVLSTYDDKQVVVLDVVPGGSPVDVVLNAGTRFSLNSTAQGKVAMAFSDDARLTLDSPLEQRTPHTKTDPEALSKELDVIRERGWADAPEETFLGINAVAAPYFGADGQLLGCLAVVASVHYLPAGGEDRFVDSLLVAAQELSRELGYSPDEE